MVRLQRHDYFMLLAHLVALRSTCDRARVGAILVRDRRVIATGYNGSPRGFPHCDEVGHLLENGHCVRTVHAEQNAILQSATHGVSTQGAILYCTHRPCIFCAKTIINSGIAAVVYHVEYGPDESVAELFRLAQLGCVPWLPKEDLAPILKSFYAVFS